MFCPGSIVDESEHTLALLTPAPATLPALDQFEPDQLRCRAGRIAPRNTGDSRAAAALGHVQRE